MIKQCGDLQKPENSETHFLLETLRSLQTELENKNISLIVENRSAATGIPFC